MVPLNARTQVGDKRPMLKFLTHVVETLGRHITRQCKVRHRLAPGLVVVLPCVLTTARGAVTWLDPCCDSCAARAASTASFAALRTRSVARSMRSRSSPPCSVASARRSSTASESQP